MYSYIDVYIERVYIGRVNCRFFCSVDFGEILGNFTDPNRNFLYRDIKTVSRDSLALRLDDR